MTSSTKPEVHNVSQHHRMRTEPQATCTEFGVRSCGRFSRYEIGLTHRYSYHNTLHTAQGWITAVQLARQWMINSNPACLPSPCDSLWASTLLALNAACIIGKHNAICKTGNAMLTDKKWATENLLYSFVVRNTTISLCLPILFWTETGGNGNICVMGTCMNLQN